MLEDFGEWLVSVVYFPAASWYATYQGSQDSEGLQENQPLEDILKIEEGAMLQGLLSLWFCNVHGV